MQGGWVSGNRIKNPMISVFIATIKGVCYLFLFNEMAHSMKLVTLSLSPFFFMDDKRNCDPTLIISSDTK